MVEPTQEELAQSFRRIMRRYGGAIPEGFVQILCPLLIPLHSIDPTILKVQGQSHWRASFSVKITDDNRDVLVRGRTGKFVPATFADGGVWREVAKGRVVEVDESVGLALGEIYVGANKAELADALKQLSGTELLEIDQFGAAAKVLSGLAEFELVRLARRSGYEVRRMPEDMARHLGSYHNYDFEFTKGRVTKRVEAKSIWGTDTRFARLIHSKSTKRPKGSPSKWTEEQRRNYFPTSSCKFATQDIIAVSLFLRTGNIRDFAFARSVPRTKAAPYGLPATKGFPEHMNQNPLCEIGDGTWYATIDDVWKLP